MQKLKLALLTLMFCNTACFANFGFYLNNRTNTELRLIAFKTEYGNLILPQVLNAGALNTYGTSTSNHNDSVGSFTYGIDSKNNCTVHYDQDWGVAGPTTYHVEVVSTVGKIFCTAIQEDRKHPSKVTVNYIKF